MDHRLFFFFQMEKHWKCQSSLDEFSYNKLQEFSYSHQEQHFVRDAFKFCPLPKNSTGATRGQTDRFWLKNNSLTERKFNLFFSRWMYWKDFFSPL